MISMKWLVIGIGILSLIILFILFLKISLKVTFLYTAIEKQCLLQVEIWKFKYTFNVLERIEKQKKKTGQKIEKAKEEGGIENKVLAQIDSMGEIVKKLQEMHSVLKKNLKKVKINQWRWHSQIGTGDAASTGIITGFAWSIKGMVVGVAGEYMHIINIPELEITPVFQGKGFASRCELTASFHIYRSIITVFMLLIFMKQQQSVSTEESVQT
ncbi:TPA: DUF2953 domain-containing protein [Bacillus thuringiensis]|nr:DUF2953 domain-containing protein [Bacillus thuringiensis]